MKALLHFTTSIGPRTVVAEIGDAATAQAVVNAHLALGERASLMDETPRTSLKDHMAKHKRAMAKAARAKSATQSAMVIPLKKRRA